MNITFISDTHNLHNEIVKDWLPGGDIICHSGDFCLRGDIVEARSFFEWFSSLPYKHKIFIAGNHDLCLEDSHPKCEFFKKEYQNKTGDFIEDVRQFIPENVIFLENSGVEVEGLKFWGSPVTPWFHHWAFNVNRGKAIKEYWDNMPKDTDILLTHGPPYKILDECLGGEEVGCEDLLNRIKEVNPLINSFGHIHESAGDLKRDGTLYLNSSLVNRQYWMVNEPIVVDIDDSKVVSIRRGKD